MKIEFDVPEFERELEISIVIRKDGEVVVSEKEQPTPPSKPETMRQKVVKQTTTAKKSGNLMDSDIFNT